MPSPPGPVFRSGYLLNSDDAGKGRSLLSRDGYSKRLVSANGATLLTWGTWMEIVNELGLGKYVP